MHKSVEVLKGIRMRSVKKCAHTEMYAHNFRENIKQRCIQKSTHRTIKYIVLEKVYDSKGIFKSGTNDIPPPPPKPHPICKDIKGMKRL